MNNSVESMVITENGFWSAIDVYVNKPNVVNKRLWGAREISKLTMYLPPEKTIVINNVKFKNVEDMETKDGLLDFITYNFNLKHEDSGRNKVEIILLELLPKIYTEKHAFNLIFLIQSECTAIFIDVTPENYEQNLSPSFTYKFKLENSNICLYSISDPDAKTNKWLKSVLMVQLVKWATEDINRGKFHLESLALISKDKYYAKYNELKVKYGKNMVKIWPECTDPLKFVYEDIAISTYLLLLWENERQILNSDKLQSYIDLGCGNGLLVYILTSEGHSGVGIDVRKRNIWDIFPNNIKLEERTITPSDFNLFPETDWIIGNHSDELTPWIPVIALRSSYQCRYFLLPCCAYNFDGTKYQRKDSSKSQYTDYLEYIEKLSIECGFNTEIDRLKIPSTKRICLIARSRNYPLEKQDEYCKKTQLLINSTNTNEGNNCWISDFKARETKERVRNCTKIDKDLIQDIVKKITAHLLEDINVHDTWSLGKTATILELVKLLEVDTLKKLKAECGGLQTLLRNNSHIFAVQCGKVQLRYPKSVSEVNAKTKTSVLPVKKKPCWFYHNHPQGCPLINSDCSFTH